MRVALILGIIAAFTCGTAESQDTGRLDVLLEVSGSDDLRATVQSYLARELRSLGDVDVSTNYEDPHIWGVSVVALRHRYMDGRLADEVSISTVFYRAIPLGWLKSRISEDHHLLLETAVSDGVVILNQKVNVTDMDTLRRTCSELVAQFDTEILEPAREYRRALSQSSNP